MVPKAQSIYLNQQKRPVKGPLLGELLRSYYFCGGVCGFFGCEGEGVGTG